jgi:hypothetical protein
MISFMTATRPVIEDWQLSTHLLILTFRRNSLHCWVPYHITRFNKSFNDPIRRCILGHGFKRDAACLISQAIELMLVLRSEMSWNLVLIMMMFINIELGFSINPVQDAPMNSRRILSPPPYVRRSSDHGRHLFWF